MKGPPVKTAICLIIGFIGLALTACSGSSSTPSNQFVPTPVADVAVGFPAPLTPVYSYFSASPSNQNGTSLTFVISEFNPVTGPYSGTFTVAPAAGSAACVAVTNPSGDGMTFAATAAKCTTTSNGSYTVTDTIGNSTPMAVTYIN